eukprot:Pgem_evm3s8566
MSNSSEEHKHSQRADLDEIIEIHSNISSSTHNQLEADNGSLQNRGQPMGIDIPDSFDDGTLPDDFKIGVQRDYSVANRTRFETKFIEELRGHVMLRC